MKRRHFLATVSATAILPMPTFAAQDTLRLKAEAVMQQILPNGDGATALSDKLDGFAVDPYFW